MTARIHMKHLKALNATEKQKGSMIRQTLLTPCESPYPLGGGDGAALGGSKGGGGGRRTVVVM